MKKNKMLFNIFLLKRNIWKCLIVLVVLISFNAICYGRHNAWFRYQDVPIRSRTEALNEKVVFERIKELLRMEGMAKKYHDDVAISLMENSHRHDIPIPILLSLMRYESYFNVNVVSNRGAVGLMQIHPVTLGYFNKKTNLNISEKSMYDPSSNIKVATFLLRDLRNQYVAKQYGEEEVWDYVFGAYFKGVGSVRNGLKPSHKKYAALVKKKAVEYGDHLYAQDMKMAMRDMQQ